MIKRWAIRCDTRTNTHGIHEASDGSMVCVEDLKPYVKHLSELIRRPNAEHFADQHNSAVRELRLLAGLDNR